MPSVKDTTRIRTLLLRWYRVTARDFPWRSAEVEPYVVFVSEIMLQQTQAPRVAKLLPVFLERFPSFQELADATNADVIMAWKGLGYNNRAIRLRDAARTIVNEHGGILPRQESVLRTLPGIGSYASASITCFAFNTYTVVLDVNVRRVYSRLSSPQPDTSHILPDSDIQVFGRSVIPKRNPSEWHHAVMDLGATICKARTTQCAACPLQQICPSSGSMMEYESVRPLKGARRSEPMLRGEPRRLWRGRVVAALRENTKGLLEAALIETVFGTLAASEVALVKTILDALVKDKIIVITNLNDQVRTCTTVQLRRC